MTGEERLEDLFQSGVALLEQGANPLAAAQALNLNGATSEFVSLFETVEAAYDLPRYRMPAAAQAALLARLTAQSENKVVPLAALPAVSKPNRPGGSTQPAGYQQIRWNRFLRTQQAVVAIALVLAIGLIIVQARQVSGPDAPAPTNLAATAMPTPVLTTQPELSPEAGVTATPPPLATITPVVTTIPQPGTTAPAVSTDSATHPFEPASNRAAATQSIQNGNRQSSTKTTPVTAATVPTVPGLPSHTATIIVPTATKPVPSDTPKPAPPAAKLDPAKTPHDDEDDRGKKGDKTKTASPHPTNTQNPTNSPNPTGPEDRQD